MGHQHLESVIKISKYYILSSSSVTNIDVTIFLLCRFLKFKRGFWSKDNPTEFSQDVTMAHSLWDYLLKLIYSLNIGLCGLILLIICQTRMPNAKNKYLARTMSFVLPFFLANYPFFKMYFNGNFPVLEYYFKIHVISLLVGAIFNVS